jgi:hypothetical protein
VSCAVARKRGESRSLARKPPASTAWTAFGSERSTVWRVRGDDEVHGLSCLRQSAVHACHTMCTMANFTLDKFIGTNRDELITRCRAKAMERSSPAPTEAEIEHGIPLFLDQLIGELRRGPSKTPEIRKSAKRHGHELLLKGFSIGQVVHDYGDVCQSVTDLAVELGAPISNDDFRTLNRCLDDAIAGAVTEYAHEQGTTRVGEPQQLLHLTNAAIVAFDVLRTGNVGVGGSTGGVLHRSLLAIRAGLVDQPAAKVGHTGKDATLVPAVAKVSSRSLA